METKELNLITNREKAIEEAGELLKNGGVVAIPTETVYGLAADAFNADAVAKIFEAKGRPQDNPVIVHICDRDQLSKVVSAVPEKAEKLMDAFWPGPLTLVMPKADAVPSTVCAGLPTVAVRFPRDKDTQDIIRAAGTPLAAPSANISGSPSPTKALHVMSDLKGKIDAVVKASGLCEVGLESTVIDMTKEPPVLLRPGAVTPEQIESVIGKIEISEGVLHQLPEGETAASPGMKYRHYAPKVKVVLVKGSYEKYRDFLNDRQSSKNVALCYKGEGTDIGCPAISYGLCNSPEEQAKELFDALRRIDKMAVNVVYARCPKPEGIGLALYNRLIRAAGFEVLDLGE
ncbi:MAG: L-threonylcarbamoyladenylate synthase [Oscillospiraceae bacterium]|nr:L-threonylcarbamoyladenylate synthase [Oscillospiraceae bacterium]